MKKGDTTPTTAIMPREEEVKKLTANAEKARAYAEGVKVKTDADRDLVTKAILGIEQEWQRGEDERKRWVKPLNDTVKRLNEKYQPSLKVLEAAANLLRTKIGEYAMAAARKSEEAKAKVMSQVEKKEITIEKAVAKIENVKEPEKTVRTDEATVTYKEERVAYWDNEEILKAQLVEAKAMSYLLVDAGKIRKAVKLGIDVPGVKVRMEKTPVIRATQ